MATTKSPLSLYAETPEDQEAVAQYKNAQQKLLESLENRNQLFDPTLLAMAQGFLAPTKTGSFGESLGNVAAQLGPVQAAEDKRAQEIAKMRFELAQANLQQHQATRADTEFRGLLGGRPPAGAPAGATGSAPAGAPAGATGAAPAAPTGAAPQGRAITSADIARLASLPGGADKAKLLDDMVKRDRERFIISMNGIVFDRDTQKYLDLEIPGQKQEAFTTRYGTFNMTPNEYSQLKQAENEGKGQEWINKFRGVAPSGGVGKTTPAGGRKTVEEQATEAEEKKTRAVETARAEVTRTQDVINASRDATGRMASYASLRSIAGRPDAKEIFGILNRPDLASAILNMVQEGVRSNGSTIQAGALEDSLRNIGLPQDQIDRYRYALATMANIQLQQAKLAAGQGSVSNFERDLFSNATISPKDNPQTILAKLSMLEARANFDKRFASALRQSKKSADDFMESPEYDNLVKEYLGSISGISQKIGSSGTRSAAPSQFQVLRGQ